MGRFLIHVFKAVQKILELGTIAQNTAELVGTVFTLSADQSQNCAVEEQYKILHAGIETFYNFSGTSEQEEANNSSTEVEQAEDNKNDP